MPLAFGSLMELAGGYTYQLSTQRPKVSFERDSYVLSNRSIIRLNATLKATSNWFLVYTIRLVG